MLTAMMTVSSDSDCIEKCIEDKKECIDICKDIGLFIWKDKCIKQCKKKAKKCCKPEPPTEPPVPTEPPPAPTELPTAPTGLP